jgi:hypothetical protein
VILAGLSCQKEYTISRDVALRLKANCNIFFMQLSAILKRGLCRLVAFLKSPNNEQITGEKM